MKTYKETFDKLKKKNEGALVAFTVIGYPDYETSLDIVKEIINAGADILELGIPFSDPIADGPSIQAASEKALRNGINTDDAFEFANELRDYTEIPIGFLSYFNLIYQRGIEKFYSDAKKSKVNSVLIADLPIEEYNSFEKNNIDTVFMITQLTPEKRIKEISALTTGFIYAVSRLGVTGAKSSLDKSALDLIKRIKKISNKPVCAGFGISSPHHVENIIKSGADGAIVGSAIIDIIAKNINNKVKMLDGVGYFVKELKKASKLRKI